MSSAQMWDPAAPAWERLAASIDDHTAVATARMLALAELQAGLDVLDLASGPGGAGLAAAELVGLKGSVLLSDVAPAMVEAAARRAADLPQVRTQVLDLTAIDAPDGAFDVVLCRHGLMFAPDPVAAVAEVARVLRPGGRFAALTWSARAENPWLGLAFDAVSAQFGVPFPPDGVPGPFSLPEPEVLADALTDGGLEQVSVEQVPAPLHATSLEGWWGWVSEVAGPLAAGLATMEDAVRGAIRDRAIAAARDRARVTADGVVLDGEALAAVGRVPD